MTSIEQSLVESENLELSCIVKLVMQSKLQTLRVFIASRK